jgi:methenyltetrahydrofolate cyclohydrolase
VESRIADLTVESFLERLASDAPAPGGGSASALAAAMGAALVQMVVGLTSGRGGVADADDALREIGLAAAGFHSELLELSHADAAAYLSVVAARRLPRGDDRERQARDVQVGAAMREATRVPTVVARRAAAVLDLAERLAPIANPHAISDVGVAATLAAAGIRGALANVEINIGWLPDGDDVAAEARATRDELTADLDEREDALRRAVSARMA